MTIKKKQCFKCKQIVYENDEIQVQRKDGTGSFAQKFNEYECKNAHYLTCGKQSQSQNNNQATITDSKNTGQNDSLLITADKLDKLTELEKALKAVSIQITDLTNTVELIAKKVGVNLQVD